MREAIGGSLMVKLIMVFLVLYVIFLAMALNYAKAFKAKNAIIDYIEQNEGNKNYVKNMIDNYLDRISYNASTGAYASNALNPTICYDEGYCLEKITDDEGRAKLKVITFINFNFFDFDNNYDFSSSFSLPVIEIVGEIQQYNPEYWDEFNFE